MKSRVQGWMYWTFRRRGCLIGKRRREVHVWRRERWDNLGKEALTP